jgi:hypothetical protein
VWLELQQSFSPRYFFRDALQDLMKSSILLEIAVDRIIQEKPLWSAVANTPPVCPLGWDLGINFAGCSATNAGAPWPSPACTPD